MSDQPSKDVIDEAKALTTDVLVALGETEWCVQMMALTAAIAIMLQHVTDEERVEQLSIMAHNVWVLLGVGEGESVH